MKKNGHPLGVRFFQAVEKHHLLQSFRCISFNVSKLAKRCRDRRTRSAGSCLSLLVALKTLCSCSALRFVAKVRPNAVRSNLSCGVSGLASLRRKRRHCFLQERHWPKRTRTSLCDEAAKRCRSTGFRKAKLFCAISVFIHSNSFYNIRFHCNYSASRFSK